MRQVNIHEAKTHLSALVNEAASGVPFVIAKAGKPLVKVVPIQKKPNRIGFLKCEVAIPSDFDQMGENEIAEIFEGEL